MTEKVLLVDDDRNILAGYRRGLRNEFRLETAAGGEQGLQALNSRGPFAMVVSDMRMSGMDGIEFLARVREGFPDTVRAMLTGYADVETAIRAVNEGGLFCFLTKPCPKEKLALSLRAGIEQYRINTAQSAVLSLAGDDNGWGKLNEQFLQLQKMGTLGMLTGGIVHNLNNLLAAIAGNAYLALEALPPETQAHGDIDQVIKNVNRAGKMVRQLLDFTRRRVTMPQVTNLNNVLADMLEMLDRLISSRIELVSILAEDLGLVRVDLSQVEQVVVNLVVNARDAMPDGGTLTVETSNSTLDETDAHRHPNILPGDYVVLAVSDTGTGMTEAVRGRLFEPFFTTKEPGKGAGLGLATVDRIVRENGGSIEVDTAPGQGTTFAICFPRIREPVH